MMYKKIKYPYLIVLGIQLLLVIIAFKDFRIHPAETVFCDYGDGLKNYFTLLSYVKSPDHNLFTFNGFNYPFGEYIYTTDNTPLFAIPFKFFCQHIYDLSDYTLAIFNAFIVLNIVVCGILAFALLRKLFKSDLIALITSVILTWTNFQVIRIWRGHFNLSLSSFIILALLLAYWWQRPQTTNRKRALIAVWIILLNYFSFFAHGYFIAILSIFQAAMLFFFSLFTFKKKEGKLSMASAILTPIISFALALGTLAITDGYFKTRKPGAGGYDWMEHKIRFWGLLTHYDFHTLHFPVKNMRGSSDPENMGYLGNIGLYTLLIVAFICVVNLPFRRRTFVIQRNFFLSKQFAPIFLGSLLMLIVSFGELYYTEDINSGLLIYNFLNPLYLVHQFTNMVEQFRDVGRFAWPFFWGFNLWMIFTAIHLLDGAPKRFQISALALTIILGGAEVKDYIDTMQGRASQENIFSHKKLAEFSKLKIDFKKYQALLALPYYNVGSETSEFVIDDYPGSSDLSMQLALYSDLPMMNVKLSRTVLEQAQILDSFIAFDTQPADLLNRLSIKPVLVFLNKGDAASYSLNMRPVAQDIQQGAIKLPERNNLQPIDSLDQVYFYEWYPKKQQLH